jgi:xanthine dehydrogenase accessory factor
MPASIYHHLQQLLNQGLTVAAATVTEVKGSAPREVGAKMVVHPLGQHIGTVGGGYGEANVIRAGLDALSDGRERNVSVDLTEPISMESMGVCGGVMNVFVEPWADREYGPLLDALVTSIDQREPVALLAVTEADGELAGARGHRCVVWQDPGRAPVGGLGLGELEAPVLDDARAALAERNHRQFVYTTERGTVRVFVDVQAPPPQLIIVGAGHIAVPLAQMARLNDFQVTVLDDRPQYAHPDRFPEADRVIAGPFRKELRALRNGRPVFDPNTYIVLVTRGHQHDVECLLEVLDDPVIYIGMIGSRRRIRAVFELLEAEQGIPAHKFDRIYAPIGIDIGAQTPAEIATCIMAEIINVLRGGPAPSLSDEIRA